MDLNDQTINELSQLIYRRLQDRRWMYYPPGPMMGQVFSMETCKEDLIKFFKAKEAKDVFTTLLLVIALGCSVSAQKNTPQKAVEILLNSRSELNRTNVVSLRTVPPQSVSVGRRDETLPLSQTYRQPESYVHYRVPEVNVRVIK